MRYCPKCGRSYDDSWGVCFDCKVLLSKELPSGLPSQEISELKRVTFFFAIALLLLSLGSFYFSLFVPEWTDSLVERFGLIVVGNFLLHMAWFLSLPMIGRVFKEVETVSFIKKVLLAKVPVFFVSFIVTSFGLVIFGRLLLDLLGFFNK